MGKRLFTICVFGMVLSALGCQKYSVSLNDKVIYTPLPVFNAYQIADEKLHNCVAQTLQDQHATSAQELTQLDCSNAGITSLAGLETFSALRSLKLSHNQLQTLNELEKLSQLQQLWLDNNQLQDISPLLHLLQLRELDLANNAALTCGDLKQLANNLSEQKPKITPPQQCSSLL